MTRLPDKLKTFIGEVKWTFAKTTPQHPHEYIVRSKVDESLFVEVVKHIRESGMPVGFDKETYIYFEEDGLVYR